MVRWFAIIFVFQFGSSMTGACGQETLFFDSGERQVALVELYTSEGCSSCPPADKWLAGLKGDDRLWNQIVPVALHVDYWNYIGWQDRFSKPEHTSRQQQYVREGAARVAYTPGFFTNGAEWSGWFRGENWTAHRPVVGNLSLTVDRSTIGVKFDPRDETRGQLEVNVAVLGMNLESEVLSGENSGRKLLHDFVAFDIQQLSLEKTRSGFKAAVELEQIIYETDDLAIVAWITMPGTQTPIQAVGGFL